MQDVQCMRHRPQTDSCSSYKRYVSSYVKPLPRVGAVAFACCAAMGAATARRKRRPHPKCRFTPSPEESVIQRTARRAPQQYAYVHATLVGVTYRCEITAIMKELH